LLLRKISKFDATRCQILRLKYTNSISAGALPQTRWGAFSASSDPLAVFKGPTSKEKAKGERMGRGGANPQNISAKNVFSRGVRGA